MDFGPGRITPATTQLVAVWRRTPTTQQVQRFTRSTTAACRFALSSTTVQAASVALPAPTRTRSVQLRRYAPPNVISRVVIGRSVQGREIRAYLVGDRTATDVPALVIGQVHGNEKAGYHTARALVNGPTIKGRRMWVIPTANPDGLAASTRRNARGVDLNRNFSYNWSATAKGTSTYSGPAAFSEPESRALRDFILTRKPRQVVSIHQPLYGIDGYQTKDPDLYKRLLYYTGLPAKTFRCSGVCRGTMLGWIDHRTPGAGITIEYGSSPTTTFRDFTARRAITFALRGSYA